jgi:hypothetical protein
MYFICINHEGRVGVLAGLGGPNTGMGLAHVRSYGYYFIMCFYFIRWSDSGRKRQKFVERISPGSGGGAQRKWSSVMGARRAVLSSLWDPISLHPNAPLPLMCFYPPWLPYSGAEVENTFCCVCIPWSALWWHGVWKWMELGDIYVLPEMSYNHMRITSDSVWMCGLVVTLEVAASDEGGGGGFNDEAV